MTQLDELLKIFREAPDLGPTVSALEDVLGRSQNAVEYGGLSDGSISESTWNWAQGACTALRTARWNLERDPATLGKKEQRSSLRCNSDNFPY